MSFKGLKVFSTFFKKKDCDFLCIPEYDIPLVYLFAVYFLFAPPPHMDMPNSLDSLVCVVRTQWERWPQKISFWKKGVGKILIFLIIYTPVVVVYHCCRWYHVCFSFYTTLGMGEQESVDSDISVIFPSIFSNNRIYLSYVLLQKCCRIY